MGLKAVEVSGLAFSYPGRAVLRDLSFSVEEGEAFALLGPNGAGKTTLFRLLATLIPAPAGCLKVFGADLAADPGAARRAIGVVFQSPALDDRLTARENLTHQGHLYGLSGAGLASRIDSGLERAGLRNRADELVGSLSGGLKRRLELAKGLLHGPRLLVMDEPSTGLDPGARRDLWAGLKELRSRKTTILLTTHWMEEAEACCDRLVILHEGRAVAQGTPAELKASVGGDVLSIETADPASLAQKIRAHFGFEAAVVDGTLRLERPDAHRLVPELAEAFPGLILSATLAKPTLEDVFIRKTGHKFWRGEAP